MAVLRNISAIFENVNEIYLSIEQGYEFDFLLDINELSIFNDLCDIVLSFDMEKYNPWHIIISVSSDGDILSITFTSEDETLQDIVINYDNQDYYVDLLDSDVFSKLLDDYNIISIATCNKTELFDYVCKLSDKYISSDIELYCGHDYNSFIEAYEGYSIHVYKYGMGMVCKYVNIVHDKVIDWQYSDDLFKHNVEPESDMMAEARFLLKSNQIKDHVYNYFNNYELNKKLFSMTDEGRLIGCELVKNMTEECKSLDAIMDWIQSDSVSNADSVENNILTYNDYIGRIKSRLNNIQKFVK